MVNYLREYIKSFCRKNKKWVATSFILLMINFPIEIILLSYLSGQIFINMANLKNNYARFIKLVLFFFLSYFLIELTIVIRDYYDAVKVPELEKEIRNSMIRIILEKNEIKYDQMAMGELVTRFLKAPIHTYYAFHVFSKFIIPFFLALVIIFIYVFFLSKPLALLYAVIFTIYSFILMIYFQKMIKQTEKKMTEEMMTFNIIEDTLNNMNTIYTTGMVEKEKENIDINQTSFVVESQNELKLNAWIKLIMSVLTLVCIVLLFVYAIHLFRTKRMTKNILVSVITLLLFLVRFLGFTCRRITEGMMTIGSVMDSNEFIDKLKKDTFIDGTAVDFITQGTIKADNVCFRYSNDSPLVFDRFSLTIPKGSRIVLIGDSGSGKSTFIRLLLGFFRLESGTITVDGTDISKSRRSYLRQNIGYIHQNTCLFDRTIMENMTYGCPGVSEEQVLSFLKENQLMPLFSRLPDGLNTRAGRGGEHLSGGMRQVVLLLRCHFRATPIVILDEATSSLDARNRKYAMVVIKKMFQSKTVIAVSHDKDIIELFDYQLVFGHGKQPVLTRRSSG